MSSAKTARQRGSSVTASKENSAKVEEGLSVFKEASPSGCLTLIICSTLFGHTRRLICGLGSTVFFHGVCDA
ncbi:hypothetical protein CMV_023392 [Castanea mollissima]|uniref:Uncharacterized protein n=1 Tax=Castanea mollissima TaxID=60419 RepID=A0A8J4QLK5_9ROSI|nr:hypothetical protein CMV_023392 [Castanea mollissima]